MRHCSTDALVTIGHFFRSVFYFSMFTNQSPWLHQLNRTRPDAALAADAAGDVAIIGAGIAGVVTAFYTLRNTDKTVVLVEAGRVAHGATGHNGGFLATYFERSFKSLIQEFGFTMSADAQKAIDSSWELLEEIRREANLQTPLWQFTGYAAIATEEELLVHLRNNALRKKAGLAVPIMLISDQYAHRSRIPAVYADLYQLLPKSEILSLIETADEDYFAILPEQKGVMNSALFSEELVGYLLSQYADRFTLVEQAPVKRAVLHQNAAVLELVAGQKIAAGKVVLCTNGFENIQLVNKAGESISKKFHHLVRGIVGYMAGYLDDPGKPPAEISYLSKTVQHGSDIYTEDPYFYLTRRPFEVDGYKHNLICIGGPEALMDDTNNYQIEHPFPQEARDQIDSFLRYTYKRDRAEQVEYKFLWHGLMGFTPNGVRLIGPEPLNPILLYNLGCNGVGLMPSIYGGWKISRFLAGDHLPPAIFDPKDLRNLGGRRVAAPRKLKHTGRHRLSIHR